MKPSRVTVVVIWLNCFLTLQGCMHRNAITRTEAVREMYRHVGCEILGMKEPVTVKEVDIYKDGGSLLIHLVDSRGKELTGCLDGRMRILHHTMTRDQKDSVLSIPRHLYLNARYVTDSTAVEVPVRGAEEAALYGLLIRWSESHPVGPGARPAAYIKWTPQRRVADFVSRLDERFAEAPIPRKASSVEHR